MRRLLRSISLPFIVLVALVAYFFVTRKKTGTVSTSGQGSISNANIGIEQLASNGTVANQQRVEPPTVSKFDLMKDSATRSKILQDAQARRDEEAFKDVVKSAFSLNVVGFVTKTADLLKLSDQKKKENMELLILNAKSGDPAARLGISVNYPEIAKQNGVYSLADPNKPKTVPTGPVAKVNPTGTPSYVPPTNSPKQSKKG